MLKRRLYYSLKPVLPWRLRNVIRAVTARQKRSAVQAVWPVNPAAAAPPPGWKGWPGGKQFAFVLTHDVEGPRGLDLSLRLAAYERERGMRSCFNFIPEGTYDAGPELRSALKGDGFEVGIHDLHHDGHLYTSREAYRRNAARINHYVREWDVRGFRSGFMLHELDWMHDLDTEYDCSTFDTDPFEPQPDAANTIFPFWVPPPHDRLDRPGYVELPYTLPQDSTVFLVLRDQTPEVWLRKLEWVAENGGMALVNVHPDYLRFDDQPPSASTFPVAHYGALLDHVRTRFAGRYWQPLPGELARWYKSTLASGTARRASPGNLRGKRAAVLLYSQFPSDSRPRRAALAMADAGMQVDLLCLHEHKGESTQEVVHGVNVYRVPITHSRGRRRKYFYNYAAFFAAAWAFLLRRGGRRRYDVVHVHNMPDFLVLAAVFQKWAGARILLDLHDPMPELMMSIYDSPPEGTVVRVLRALERRSINFAHAVITTNLAFVRLFAERNRDPKKIHLVMNSPDEAVFDPDVAADVTDPPRMPGEFRLMHHGAIVHRHGVDLLVEAVGKLRSTIPGIRLDIYGRREPFLDLVLETARRVGVSDVVAYHGNKNEVEIAAAIRRTDLGIIPNRRNPFTSINFPTRIFEYLALDRLVVAPSTIGIRDYFAEADLLMFEQDAVDALAAKILWARDHPEAAREVLARGRQVYQRHLWSQEKARFLELVSTSLARR